MAPVRSARLALLHQILEVAPASHVQEAAFPRKPVQNAFPVLPAVFLVQPVRFARNAMLVFLPKIPSLVSRARVEHIREMLATHA